MRISKFLLLIAFVIFNFTANAQDNLSTKLINKTRDFIEEKMESDQIVGVGAALIVNDSIVWEKAFGYADLENQVPMTENTIFHLGSITKPITALCAMQLQERGLLDINESVTKYLPQFNPKNSFGDNSEITVKNLITHSAGLQADVYKNSDLYSGKYTDVVDFINETHLIYPPGKFGLYANPGYNILGHIIKEVSGMDYAEYVHANIFKPLGMSNSGFFMDSLENRTKIYNRQNKLQKEYPIRDIASGGIYCSLHDFVLLAKGIINSYHGQSPSLVSSSGMQEIFSVQNGDADYVIDKNKRGLGWYLFENAEGALAANHTGSAGFAFAHLMIFPKDKAALMIFSNSPNGRNLAEYAGYNLLEDFQLEIADVFPPSLIKEEETAYVDPFQLSTEDLEGYVGNYSEVLSYTKVILENNRLQISRNGKQFSLIPKTSNSFAPINKEGMEIKGTRYYFKELGSFSILVVKQEDKKEQVLGYQFAGVNKKDWEEKTGNYEHFGYQILAGDMKFKSLELKITEDNVLMAVINPKDYNFSLPLDVLSPKYAKTAGVLSSYGMTLSFSENDQYHFVDFAGITFRKEK